MAPVSVAIRVGVLLRGLTVLDPDMTGPGSLELMPNLKQAAPPSRKKLATVVAATELFAADDDPLTRACTPVRRGESRHSSDS
jgi:hypothetical protein